MKYLAFIHTEPDKPYWVSFPDLPGCFTCGDTEEEAKKNIPDALETYLTALKEEGIKVPPPRSEEEIMKTVELPPPGFTTHFFEVKID
ncbi:MAG: type II toxin-antitoxin system HicB family antitoxin [Nitrospinales bacterium]